MAALMLATVGVMLPVTTMGKTGGVGGGEPITLIRTLTTGPQLTDGFAHAVSEYVDEVKGATVIDCVVSPPGLQEYEVGLPRQLVVSVTGVPGATGAAAVAAGEALIVQLTADAKTVMLITALQKLEAELLHAVSENVFELNVVTVIDCVV